MQTFQDHYCQINNINIRYWCEGNTEKPVLLLVHGIGACVEYWHKVIQPLSQHFRVIACDLPGFGKSDKPNVVYDFSFFIDTLHGFVDALKIDDFYLCGHSMGGGLSLGLSLKLQHRIKKLVLADSVGFASNVILPFRLMGRPVIGSLLLYLNQYLIHKALATSVFDVRCISSEFEAQVQQFIAQPGTRRAMASITQRYTDWSGIRMDRLDFLTTRYDELKSKPILVFWGKQDGLLETNIHIKSVKHFLPNAEIKLINQCGHVPQLEHPTLFCEKLISFIQD